MGAALGWLLLAAVIGAVAKSLLESDAPKAARAGIGGVGLVVAAVLLGAGLLVLLR